MKSVLLFLMLVLVFSSCQTSNSVVSKFGIQKRKYTKGWHTSKRKNFESLQAKKTTTPTPTDVTLSLKKSDVIEKVKLKNKKNLLKPLLIYLLLLNKSRLVLQLK